MRIIHYAGKVTCLLAIILMVADCTNETGVDPCLKTKWYDPKTLEIKLAVHMMDTNPQLPGGSIGSLNPVDFAKMSINGAIEKINCDKSSTGASSLGNSYITKGVDIAAPVTEPETYWIGHFVYVYEFENDNDHLKLSLNVKITMLDGQSYTCNVSENFYSEQIVMVPGEMYYYVVLDIYSDQWSKL